MTVQPVAPGQVQQWSGDTGLDDMNMSDAVIPRIKIEHKDGLWSENLTESKVKNLYFVVLGLVKQRVLFHPNVEDGDVPMCKSSNYAEGFPNPEAKQGKTFPWDKAGFKPEDFAPGTGEQYGPLPCSGCALKDWGSHPMGNAPYCAEQWTMPIYYDSSGQPGCHDDNVAWDPEQAEWTAAILTLQKSSLKPIRSYLSSFKAGGRPPFLNVAKGTLKVIQRGQVIYSVPSFNKGPESDRSKWNEFAVQYGEMREFLTRPPVREEEEIDGVSVAPADNSWGGQTSVTPPAAADPWAAAPQTTQPGDPWTQTAPAPEQPPVQQAPPQPAAPVQPQAPVEQPPVQQAPPEQPAPAPVEQPPVQQAPPAAPVQPQAPVQPVAPEQPPVQQAPPQQPAPTPAPAPTPPAGQALPF